MFSNVYLMSEISLSHKILLRFTTKYHDRDGYIIRRVQLFLAFV